MHELPPPRHWSEAVPAVLALAAHDLDTRGAPQPTLVAFSGDDPCAVVTLRPFEPGDVLQACIELLALLLPLGADRVVLGLPVLADRDVDVESDHGGSPTSTQPMPSRVPQERLLMLVVADAHIGTCRTRVLVHRATASPSGWRWGEPGEASPGAVGAERSLTESLTLLLDHRLDLDPGLGEDPRLAAQLGRVLLLGHRLTIAPSIARRLASTVGTRQPPASPTRGAVGPIPRPGQARILDRAPDAVRHPARCEEKPCPRSCS